MGVRPHATTVHQTVPDNQVANRDFSVSTTPKRNRPEFRQANPTPKPQAGSGANMSDYFLTQTSLITILVDRLPLERLPRPSRSPHILSKINRPIPQAEQGILRCLVISPPITQIEFQTLPGDSMPRHAHRWQRFCVLALSMAIFSLTVACGSDPTPTPTTQPGPTSVPQPTEVPTVAPTKTPAPTAAPAPTNTLEATSTPTPQPANTPLPTEYPPMRPCQRRRPPSLRR